MLQIKDIRKVYKTGDLVQTALDGVSLNLRDNEFVAILGPSGSGKTTLLNIIGGLDQYDEGDLIINGVSTKNYKAKDLDTYRNHTIGFVFQSYNLIPHQTILSNVELALTIAGEPKKIRRQKALEALDRVGLKDQAHKKPNQMSGGQMQRVAIARALVNNPDIVLADEPTGALDTKTSVQVMDLLKEVAKDRLVVMVTHNPDLANEYANRIIKLKDGKITDDSNPFEVIREVKAKKRRSKKASMNFLTALSLSFNNLLTKKGRTILTAFAGSIGIIGIALILALSTGFQNYIDKIQEDTMSSYPLSIQSETANIFGALLSTRTGSNETDISDGKIHEQMLVGSIMDSVGSNDLKSFTKWLEENPDKYENDVKEIVYSYSVSPRIYTRDITNEIVQLNPNTLMSYFYSDTSTSLLSGLTSSTSMGTFSEHDIESLKDNSQLITGRYPEKYNELIIVLSEEGKISDLLVYTLGLRDNSELKKILTDLMSNQETEVDTNPMTFTYDQLMNVELKLVDVSNLYKYNDKYSTYEDMTSDKDYMNKVYDEAETLKIVGIAYSDSDSTSMFGVIYTPDLVKHVINLASESPIVQKQLKNKDVDVFSNNRFDEENNKTSELNFNDMVSVDEDVLKEAFKINISEDDFKDVVDADEILENAQYVSDHIASETQTMLSTAITPIYQGVAGGMLTAVNTQMKTVVPQACPVAGGGMQYNTDGSIVSCPIIEGYTYTEMTSSTGKVNVYENYYSIVYPFNDTTITQIQMGQDLIFDAVYNMMPSEATSVVNKTSLKTVALTTLNTYLNNVKNDIPYTDINVLNYQVGIALTTSLQDPTNASLMLNDAMSLAGLKLSGEAIGNSVGSTMEGVASLFGEDMMSVDTDKFAEAFNFDMDEDELSRLMSSMLTKSDSTYTNNLTNLGYQNFDEPTFLSIYFNDFDSKENFLNTIDEYNELVNDEEKEIKYTDITGLLMGSVKTIIDSVTYVLIAFVSISLVVSSIMIAVITLISVMERTKEIGILRAMGASKHNVSSIFNAETFIIGLLSGLLGVGVTFALIPPINSLIHNLTNNYDINAVLPTNAAIALVLISVILTIFAGIIPSRSAAKQDPVIALRSE